MIVADVLNYAINAYQLDKVRFEVNYMNVYDGNAFSTVLEFARNIDSNDQFSVIDSNITYVENATQTVVGILLNALAECKSLADLDVMVSELDGFAKKQKFNSITLTKTAVGLLAKSMIAFDLDKHEIIVSMQVLV